MEETLTQSLTMAAAFTVLIESMAQFIKVFNFPDLFTGIKKIFKRQDMTGSETIIFTFLLGFLGCYLADYGVIQDIIRVGEKAREGGLRWFDYVCTGATMSRGSGLLYDLFENWRKKWGANKIKLEPSAGQKEGNG